MKRLAIVLVVAALAAGAEGDLASIKADPDLERRADQALEYARDQLKTAEAAYTEKDDLKQTEAGLKGLTEAVQLAYDSLLQTRKNPSKRPKHFKKAEIRTRELMRRLDDFRAQMSADDRVMVEPARHELQKVHDALLEGIMGGGKKK